MGIFGSGYKDGLYADKCNEDQITSCQNPLLTKPNGVKVNKCNQEDTTSEWFENCPRTCNYDCGEHAKAIKHIASGKCVHVKGGTDDAAKSRKSSEKVEKKFGKLVFKDDCTDAPKFYFKTMYEHRFPGHSDRTEPVSPGYVLKMKGKNLCVHVEGSNKKVVRVGALLVLYTCELYPTTRWKINSHGKFKSTYLMKNDRSNRRQHFCMAPKSGSDEISAQNCKDNDDAK